MSTMFTVPRLHANLGIALVAAALAMNPSDVRASSAERLNMNGTVIVMDGSETFGKQLERAIAKAMFLLDGMATRKLNRWEPATDRIIIISLDALPEVVWEGTLSELKSQGTEAWKSRFEARTDFAQCTNLVGAVHTAIQRLNDPRITGKYLFMFSVIRGSLRR